MRLPGGRPPKHTWAEDIAIAIAACGILGLILLLNAVMSHRP